MVSGLQGNTLKYWGELRYCWSHPQTAEFLSITMFSSNFGSYFKNCSFFLIDFITFTLQWNASIKKLINKTVCSFSDLTWTEQWQNPVYFLWVFIILRVWHVGLLLWLPPSKNNWHPRFHKGWVLARKDRLHPCVDSVWLHAANSEVHKNAGVISRAIILSRYLVPYFTLKEKKQDKKYLSNTLLLPSPLPSLSPPSSCPNPTIIHILALRKKLPLLLEVWVYLVLVEKTLKVFKYFI